MPHIIIFTLFYDQRWQRGVLKVMKNDPFLVLLVVWVVFPRFLVRLMSCLC